MMEIRYVEAVTAEDVKTAVKTARALVEIYDRLEETAAEVVKRDAEIERMRASAQRAETERRKLTDRMSAVQWLHREAEQVACGDGCCHEGLGHCDYDEEPWPCRTIRVLDGKDGSA